VPTGERKSSAPGMVGKNKYYVDVMAISLGRRLGSEIIFIL
jgi:hypothetical protein